VRRVHPAGLVGRALAAIGALLWIVALFLDVGVGIASKWDIYGRLDIVTLAAAIAVLVFLLASLFVGEELLLFLVGVSGGFLVADGAFDLIEYSDQFDAASGTYLSIVGAGLIILGAALALLVRREEVLAFMPAAGVQAPAAAMPAAAPVEPAAAAPGWYSDPSGQARLRYWDGQTWTEQTQE
jgi:hypothetical protein